MCSVGRLGSMGAAGREHGLSQQAVSARVRSVERQLGIKVFDRAATGVRPTAEGGLILEWASHILRSEEHTSELQSLMRISYAVFCLKKKTNSTPQRNQTRS